ncbi:MAG: class I SAM-dependent methyltransferase [bacterium]
MSNPGRPLPHPKAGLPLSAAERQKLRRRSFDSIAGVYDRVRPRYPEQLFDELVRLCGVDSGARVLEIGPGTGQATLPLARRGLVVVGVELAPRMARLCRANLRDFPSVTVHAADFEHWPVEPASFDLVLSASAFHWLSPRTAFGRAAAALRPGGSIALLWHFRVTPSTPLQRELDAVYAELGLKPWRGRPPEERTRRQREAILNSGRFGPVTIRRYPSGRDYTTDDYVALLRTMSDHAILPAPTRRRLFAGIRRAIDRHGGMLHRESVATLFIAPLRRS